MSQIVGTISAIGGSVVVPVSGTSAVAVTIEGTWTDTLSFQVSYDNGGTWNGVSLNPVGSGSAAVSSVAGNGTWIGPIGPGGLFQVISTGGAHTGTATVFINTAAKTVSIVHGPLAPGSTGTGLNPVPVGWIDGSGDIQLVNCNQNVATPLLVSSARTQNALSAVQTNTSSKGVIIYVDVTGGGGGAGMTVNILGIDPFTGANAPVFTDSTAITTQGEYAIRVYPGMASTFHVGGQTPLPPSWQLKMSAGDTTSFTYSAAAGIIAR